MSQPPKKVTAEVWIGFMAMVVGMFMAILDIQIVSSSLTEIQAGLSASMEEVSWVQTSYLIAEVISIPLSGFLSRLLSTRILFFISAIGFTVMSAFCSLAWNIESMIVFRALQGFVGGAMIPTVFATSFVIFPPEKRPMLMALIGLVVTAAPTLGPTIGGYITQSLSWHWMFLINILPGILVCFAVWNFANYDQPDYSLLKGFDFQGSILMATFLGTLEYLLEEGPRKDWFEDQIIASLTIVTVISGYFFIKRVLNYHNPIVELRAFKDKNFAIGSLFSFIIGIGLYGAVYLLPFFLSHVRELNSFQIGVIMIVTGAFQMLAAPIAGMMSAKVNLRMMLTFGISFFALSCYYNSLLTKDSDFEELFLPQALRGFSLMFCFIPLNTLALGTIPHAKLKNASGLYNLTRNLGGALGLAIINTISAQRLAFHKAHLRESINNARAPAQFAMDYLTNNITNSEKVTIKLIDGIIQREAFIMAFNDCFLVVALFLGLSIILIPFVKNVSINSASQEAH
jgi:DHA2 family multidrug resistance protein